MRIPLFHSKAAIAGLLPEIAERQADVLRSGRYILGPEVAAFETEFAGYLGVDHCVGVGNGTDALTIALRALGVVEGDEVVVPTVTFCATAEAVANAGATPVFADVDERTWCMTPETLEPALSERTAAIVPVHLFGNPAPVPKLRDVSETVTGREIPILEDAAQAAGARLDGRMAGSLGTAATFSFYPSKNLGAFGDGGAIVTDDPEIADRCRRLRSHGSLDKVTHNEIGWNSRLDEIQATALRVLLPHLESWTSARRDAALRYAELGLGELVELPAETTDGQSCYHLFVVTSESRDELARDLGAQGIEARTYYTPSLPSQPAMKPFAPSRHLPGTNSFKRRALALPLGPCLSEEDAAAVVTAVREAVSR